MHFKNAPELKAVVSCNFISYLLAKYVTYQQFLSKLSSYFGRMKLVWDHKPLINE